MHLKGGREEQGRKGEVSFTVRGVERRRPEEKETTNRNLPGSQSSRRRRRILTRGVGEVRRRRGPSSSNRGGDQSRDHGEQRGGLDVLLLQLGGSRLEDDGRRSKSTSSDGSVGAEVVDGPGDGLVPSLLLRSGRDDREGVGISVKVDLVEELGERSGRQESNDDTEGEGEHTDELRKHEQGSVMGRPLENETSTAEKLTTERIQSR